MDTINDIDVDADNVIGVDNILKIDIRIAGRICISTNINMTIVVGANEHAHKRAHEHGHEQ
eukprot:6610490-Lingulodinium_polyedra.AAC.1